jgi:hypothetical protein
MTRSNVLLYCQNPRINPAVERAWDSKQLGSVRVLLANPWWERRLLEKLRVGGIMESGEGENETARHVFMDVLFGSTRGGRKVVNLFICHSFFLPASVAVFVHYHSSLVRP